MAKEKRQYLLYLIVALSRTRENAIVPAFLVIHGFHWLPSPSQRCLKVVRHLYVRGCRTAVVGAIRCAMQHQDGDLDLRGQVKKMVWIAGGVEDDGLHVTPLQAVVEGRSTTT